ncbi:metal ABC transporter ATP-binding protein [Kocuria massiliensis]|uniref:metal ABC transporter ATP-binding protein n=1 Tax=Kocuria massiliensis TaxID=1926282 RepID=UPI0022B9A22B|nr:ATP-binding cassette domain-containing protein [Kocuria massiliensis]
MSPSSTVSVSLRSAALSFGDRVLWDDLSLDIHQGEYFAILGPNGSGKSTFLKTLLGLLPLSAGEVSVLGEGVRRGNPHIGYVPQQRAFSPETPLRARDLVGLGLDGHRWGPGVFSRKRRARVDELLERVGATEYAAVPVGLLSGGEQQRLRVAQALASRPEVLLCDEALLSLDLRHQSAVSQLIEDYRRESGVTVIFVTHEINPIIDDVDRVLYLANGRFTVGSVDEVMSTETLSRVYDAPVTVMKIDGRYVVVGANAMSHASGDDCHAHDVEGEA